MGQSTVLENVRLGPNRTFLELLQPYSGRLDTGPQTEPDWFQTETRSSTHLRLPEITRVIFVAIYTYGDAL